METQVDNSTFQIKIAGFKGPFGLLLSLIEKRKLFINDISLSAVTEDYLQYMNKLGDLPPVEVSSFILVASTLLLIKSKSLLPNLNLTSEEEGDIKNLEERLRLYEIFTKLGENIKNDFGRKIIFAPLERKPARLGGNNLRAWGHTTLVFLPDERITKDSMMTFARNALSAMPQKVFLPKVEVKTVISIEEMIDKLTLRITNAIKMNFSEFVGKSFTRDEKIFVIVGFLAMLELARNGILNAAQNDHSSDIFIEKREDDYELEITN